MRRAEVIVNAAAGSVGGREDVAQRVEGIFREVGWDVRVAMVEPAGLMAAIESAAERGPEVLVVGGGDGTIRGAAGVAMARGLALGILPLGTMNLLAKDLGLPLDPEDAARVVAEGRVKKIDVGEVNGSLFLHSSILGLVPRLGEDRERIRAAGVSLETPQSVWRMFQTLQRAARLRVEMKWDGGSARVRTHMLAVVNNPVEEDGIGVFARASVDAGMLSVYAFRHGGPFALVGLAWSIVRGKLRRDPAVLVHDVHEMEIVLRRNHARVSNDGEVERMGRVLRYRILAGALDVVVPGENDG